MNTLNKFAWTVVVDLTFICWFMHLHVEWTQATMHYLGLLVDFSWVLVRLKCLKGSYDAFFKIIILGFNVQKHIIFQILYIIVGPLYPARVLRVRRLIRILGPSQSFFPFYQNSLYRALWNQIYFFLNSVFYVYIFIDSVYIFLDSFLMVKLNCINQKACLIN